MKSRIAPIIVVAFLLFQAACTLNATPTPTAGPTAEPPTAEVLVVPRDTEAPSEAAPAPVAAGPRAVPAMEVGATFQYFDGVLLDAVPEGSFTMGNDRPDAPIRIVTLPGFWIYSIEVNNFMYALCVKVGKCTPPDAKDNPIFEDPREGNKPVVGVTWQQAADYCDFAHARLPTEAEWEKTARGPDGYTYPWGEDPPDCSLLNFDACVHKTTFVGSYPDGQSYYKAWDMAGNVFEWISDWYLPNYYPDAPTEAPPGPETGTEKVVRSTAYNSDGFLTEAARRFSELPDNHRADLGFRCVVEDPSYFAPFCTQLLVYGKPAGGGSGSGEDVGEICTDPAIDQQLLNCTQTNVWVDDNGGLLSSTTGLDTCADGGMMLHNGTMQHLYTCGGPIRPIGVCGTCKYPLPSGGATCPADYHQDGDQCVIDHGTTGECPEGSVYDPVMMCCSVTTGAGAVYDLCPAGYSYIPGPPAACVNYIAGDVKCDPQMLNFKQGCGEGNQPDCEEHPEDPACQPGGCPPNNPDCGPGGGGPGACDPQKDPNCSPTTGG